MITRNARTFLRTYISSPSVTGAIAPSSRGLARALTHHLRNTQTPSRILEVGAGTGPVTTVIGECLKAEDHLDICEIQPDLADLLDRGPLSRGALAKAREEGRVRLLRSPVQELVTSEPYDFIISGLPLTAFRVDDVREIVTVIRKSIRPGGVFSYFEYIALRYLGRTFGRKATRERVGPVSAYLDTLIVAHQVGRQSVFFNIPPAYARHLTFPDPIDDGK